MPSLSLGAMSPRTFARKAADRAVMSFINGLVYVTDGAARPQIGNAPKDLILREGKLELYRLRPLADEEVELGHTEITFRMAKPSRVPLLIIPPLMVRPFVYDLRPEHSMLRTLRNAGFDVFMVDFGVPDKTDEGVRLDDYVLDYVPRCIDAALEASGAEELSLVGYCMGGLFALLHVATFADTRVRNIVTIGAPVNFDKMGILSWAAQLGTLPLGKQRGRVVDTIIDAIGNVPGVLSSTAFRLLGGTRAITQYKDLLVNLYDEEYVRSFDAIDTWLRRMIPYPKEAFRQMFDDVVTGNKMLKNELSFGERRADMRNIRCALLAFAGRSDNVAPPQSTAEILDLVASRDKTYREVKGGHIGIVGGSSAPVEVWSPMIDWLRAHEP